MLGIALGITALITVMSVMNGFQKEVRAGMISVASHIQMLGYEKGLSDWSALMSQTRTQKDVVGVAPFVNGQGLLAVGQSVRGVGIRGIDPELEATVSDIGQKMRIGKTTDLKPGEYGIVLGSYLARALSVNVGDRIQLITPQGTMTPAGMQPRLRSFTVVGVFSSGHYEYDLNLALIHLRDAQVLFRLDENVTGLRVKVTDVNNARAIARRLQDDLKFNGYVQDWTVENATYFRAVEIEKRMMFIILTLIIAVAAFNLVSTLVMVVRDKHPDIAILRTLGASPGMIMRIFVVQGALVGTIGTLIGVIGGILLALNVGKIVATVESAFGFRVLSPEVYFLSYLPSDLHFADVWVTALISLILALVATLYPSWRASKVNPVEALRYE
jgi:lipoprotein-releasing system permease protein